MGTNKRYSAQTDARVSPRVAWHPILDATEIEPAHWVLRTSSTGPLYAAVRMVRRGPELGYRVETLEGELIGYYRSLRSAVFHAWDLTIAPKSS
jgi:hypothetical protein